MVKRPAVVATGKGSVARGAAASADTQARAIAAASISGIGCPKEARAGRKPAKKVRNVAAGAATPTTTFMVLVLRFLWGGGRREVERGGKEMSLVCVGAGVSGGVREAVPGLSKGGHACGSGWPRPWHAGQRGCLCGVCGREDVV